MAPFDITALCELLCCVRADTVKLLVFLNRDTFSCFIDYRVITQSPHTCPVYLSSYRVQSFLCIYSSNYSILGGTSHCTINHGLTYIV